MDARALLVNQKPHAGSAAPVFVAVRQKDAKGKPPRRDLLDLQRERLDFAISAHEAGGLSRDTLLIIAKSGTPKAI
jgi:hypothetical protein